MHNSPTHIFFVHCGDIHVHRYKIQPSRYNFLNFGLFDNNARFCYIIQRVQFYSPCLNTPSPSIVYSCGLRYSYMEWTHLFIYSSQLPLLLTWFILVDWDAVYGVNSPVHLLIATSIVIDMVYSCGLRCSIWSCSFTYRSYHCYWLGLFLWTEMLYMELTHMFIYSSQLPLLFTLLILVDWDALYGVVHLLIAATIAIGLAYSRGLRHSIWSESIHENLILENSVWVGQAMDSWQINRLKYQLVLVFFIKAILVC